MRKLLLGFVLVFVTLFTNVLAEDNPRAVIIFDASGSMWGQINGVTKIEIARDALKNVVREWNPNVELGLTVYGHRTKGDCNDIETVIPVGKIDKNRVIKTVMSIKPKGKTPISRSLRKVANEIKYTEEKATIILISDGKETCDPDPCATAKALEKDGIDFVTHVIGFNVDKKTDMQLECIADATGGEYFSAKDATALNDAMKVIVKKVEVVEPPKPIVKKLDYNLEVTASEKEDGKWIKATHYIYQDEEGKVGERAGDAHSKKKTAGTDTLPVGKYIIKSAYNAFKKETPFEIKAGEVTKVHIVFGQTGTVEVTASEKEDGKWIKATHYIYQDEEGKVGERAGDAHSKKKTAGTDTLPVGKYIIKSAYNAFKKETPFEIKAGEVTKVHIVFGQTGTVEVTASEKEDGKWVKARHYIYQNEEGKVGERAGDAHSKKKTAGTDTLPVGKYIIKSAYNAFKKETPFEIKAGEVTKVHIVFGQTGTVEISASETEGGKWVKLYGYIYPADENGKKDGGNVGQVNNRNGKESSIHRIPAGKYIMEVKYNNFKKEVVFNVDAGETKKVHIVMGQTGDVEVSASQTEGGKWVKLYGYIYPADENGKKDGGNVGQVNNRNSKDLSKHKLPVGKYIMEVRHNDFKKEVVFDVDAGKTRKVHVIFSQFTIEAKCTDMNAKIAYEVYASSGRLVFDKETRCSDVLEVTLDGGDYNVEAKVGNDIKAVKFTVGGDQSKLLVDMTDIKKEPTKEELIQADTQETPVLEEVKQGTTSTTNTVVENQAQEQNSNTLEMDVNEVKKSLSGLGALFGGAGGVQKSIESKPMQGIKESLIVALPYMEKTKECYGVANTLEAAKLCDVIANEGAKIAQDKMESVVGIKGKMAKTINHTEWDEDIRVKELAREEKDIKNAKLYIVCIDKGVSMGQLKECAANNGEFEPQKTEVEQLGDMLKMFGGMK